MVGPWAQVAAHAALHSEEVLVAGEALLRAVQRVLALLRAAERQHRDAGEVLARQQVLVGGAPPSVGLYGTHKWSDTPGHLTLTQSQKDFS